MCYLSATLIQQSWRPVVGREAGEPGSSGQAGAEAGLDQGRPHKQSSSWRQQLGLFKLAAVDQTERLWQVGLPCWPNTRQ